MLRRYRRYRITDGAALRFTGFRFVPKVNHSLPPRGISIRARSILRPPTMRDRARLTTLRHQLLKAFALDRVRRGPRRDPGRDARRLRPAPDDADLHGRRTHAVPNHIGIAAATVASWRLRRGLPDVA